jgi:hypothetical protein
MGFVSVAKVHFYKAMTVKNDESLHTTNENHLPFSTAIAGRILLKDQRTLLPCAFIKT